VAENANATTIQLSQRLATFVTNLPHERKPILELVLQAATEIPPGSRLLDVGAGDSPYRELFRHVRYETADWEMSFHVADEVLQHVGPAHAIPVGDGEFDAVLCTQVLEHVPNPAEVIQELFRVLAPGGRLYMTLPFVWELHEIPWDFYRYTSSSLHRMLDTAGFGEIDIRARNDSFGTLAQLLRNVAGIIGPYPDGRDADRERAAGMLRAMATQVESYVGLDKRWLLPLGYALTATRPDPEAPPPAALSAEQLSDARATLGFGSARSFVTLCFADDALLDPFMLSAYAKHFSAADDATLVVYAPGTDPGQLSVVLQARVEHLGMDGPDSPDMIGIPFRGRADEALLAASVDAVLAPRPPWGTFAGLPWAHPGTLADIHGRVGRG